MMADENNPGNAPFASTDVKVSLHGLADGFTKGPYNVLMGGLLGDITLGRAPSLSEHEVKSRTIHFMRLKTFCLQFVRLRVSREQREKERLRAEGITAELDAIIVRAPPMPPPPVHAVVVGTPRASRPPAAPRNPNAGRGRRQAV